MRGSLSVRVNDGYTDRMVTSRTTGLRFRKTAPGGHHSASCTISVPRDTFRDLGPADKLYIYDSRTARTVWEGYTENPGATDGPAGQRYELSAMGAQTLASDSSSRYLYIDKTLGGWVRDTGVANFPENATAGAEEGQGASQGPWLKTHFPVGSLVGTGSLAQAATRLMFDGFLFGALCVDFYCGRTDVGYRTQFTSPTATFNIGDVNAMNTGNTANSTTYGDTIGATNAVGVRLIRTGGATNVADDTVWCKWYNVSVLGRRMTRYGVLTNPSTDYASVKWVRAHEVVEDLLGRVLTMCDPGSSTIQAATAHIEQLLYLSPVKARQILDDLSLWEPDFLWEMLESSSSGKHRFNYRAWPTTPRYEISVKDGYNAPGGEVDLCNRVTVSWVDALGMQQATVVTSTVPELGSRVRDADPVALPDGIGNATDAQVVGAAILAGKTANAPKAATAVVRRPVVDSLRGCMVMPWEIEPGYLVRVRETGEDLRMTEMEYTDADCAATLTLGTPVLSVEQILARLG